MLPHIRARAEMNPHSKYSNIFTFFEAHFERTFITLMRAGRVEIDMEIVPTSKIMMA